MRKILDIDIAGRPVVLSRRRGTRHLRISIKSDGKILLSAPWIVSEKRAIDYLLSKQEWIAQHIQPKAFFENNTLIGKGGRVRVELQQNAEPSVRLHKQDIVVKVSSEYELKSTSVQDKIAFVADKSIKKQAETLLPQRLEQLSQKHGIKYRSVSVRKLHSRWGSCDSKNNIVLNMYLVQLEWPLIDYVILHELVHTQHKHHQKDFWDKVQQLQPEYKSLRNQLKDHPTTAYAQ